MKVALPHEDNAWRKRRDHRADDFRSRLLKRLGEDSDAELERRSACEGDLEAVVREVDVVGRVALPDREDDVDRLGKNLVAVEVEDSDRFGIRRKGARTH